MDILNHAPRGKRAASHAMLHLREVESSNNKHVLLLCYSHDVPNCCMLHAPGT